MSIISRILVAIGALALIFAYFVPAWSIYLVAPQYPEGLSMQIWLNKISGQVEIINGLNHYIGMKHIDEKMFPEFGFLVYILGVFIVFGLVIALRREGRGREADATLRRYLVRHPEDVMARTLLMVDKIPIPDA